MQKIAVIGGGPSGMMAAITAAQAGAEVLILEQKEKLGKKLLSTGNGRCNFTNLHQEPICYHCEDMTFPWRIVEKFNVQQTVSFFLSLGVYSRNRNGYLYPQSDQASAVLEVLRLEAERLGVKIQTSVRCTEILPSKKGFQIYTDRGTVRAGKVVLSAGSKAAPALGSDGSGYTMARRLGHTLVPVLPALVQLRCRETFYKKIAGVRANGSVSVYIDGALQARDQGEIQLTDYGISGIPIFQVSRYASIGLFQKKQVTAVLNFMPDFTKEQFTAFLKRRIEERPEKKMEDFFTGLFHQKLSALWLHIAHVDGKKQAGACSDQEIEEMAKAICSLETEIQAANPFEKAQVCRGGVATEEVCPETLESLRIPGLYFAGEILDVDGLCGGYNLQWAWSSGYVAGKAAAGS